MLVMGVALHAEGVDRNPPPAGEVGRPALSPSMRRAWIEMIRLLSSTGGILSSPSMRRAWIEIVPGSFPIARKHVALHAEGVDRNDSDALHIRAGQVALHAEGVDRNTKYYT